MSLNLKRGHQTDLQGRLRDLSLKTNCPTRQENGQRYLGPPVNWSAKPPVNAEVFISKLPFDCFEDEIYHFCSQAGNIYLIRLMINFENENRGFCFVTFSSSKEANAAVALLPQNPLRKGYYIHAEISLNNCTLKIYGLDFKWNDENLEKEIRSNAKDVSNITIRRNMAQKTLMATLYFDTHQKAAIARRKLSQIANSRWGQNVKVFLWSKKLQNKYSTNQDNGDEKNINKKKITNKTENSSLLDASLDFELNESHQSENKTVETPVANFDFQSWLNNSKLYSNQYENISSATDDSSSFNTERNYFVNDVYDKTGTTNDLNNNAVYSTNDVQNSNKYAKVAENYENFPNTYEAPASHRDTIGAIHYGSSPTATYSNNWSNGCSNVRCTSLFPLSNESSPGKHSKSSLSDDSNTNWTYDSNAFATKSEINYSLDDAEEEASANYSNKYSTIANTTTFDWYPDKQIELILKEALDALVKSSINN